MAMCLSKPHSSMIFCHSAIDRPYFFSIEGKYDVGPTFDQGEDSVAIDDYFLNGFNYTKNVRSITHRIFNEGQ